MRPQIVVLGPIQREMYVRLTTDLLPPGEKQAEEISWRIVGCGVTVSERLSRLGLSTAIITGIGISDEDREVLRALRKRGIKTRGTRSGTGTTPITVRVRTPRHEVVMSSPAPESAPSRQAILRALPGSRHFHVCSAAMADSSKIEMVAAALTRARNLGASTSLDVHGLAPASDWLSLRQLLPHVDVLFADSERMRALADRPRVGAAAAATLAHGVHAVAVRLGAGGSRIYSPDDAVRIPSLGAEVEGASIAFASGFLLGWLLSESAAICGVFGSSAALGGAKSRLPDRRELASRMAKARANPMLSKLVPTLGRAQRVLDRARRLPRRDLTASAGRASR